MSKYEQAIKTYKFFLALVNIFGATDPERTALNWALNAGFSLHLPLADGAHATVYGSFDRMEDENSLSMGVNWPAIGTQHWTTALAFGDGLAEAARSVRKATDFVKSSNVTQDDVYRARDVLDTLAQEVRARFKEQGVEKPTGDQFVQAALKEMGL